MQRSLPAPVARPWGSFQVVEVGARHQIKRLHVNPGARLSLQSHRLRSELWCVVEGAAEATLDGATVSLSYGEVLAIPVGAQHRLANPHAFEPLVVVEIQTGESFDEDDIIRYEDDYLRT